MTTTRSGRTVKKPTVFVPTETVLEDDYCSDEYDDTDDAVSDIDTEDEYYSDDSDDEELDDDDDADENGNLKDFVVDDEEESESE